MNQPPDTPLMEEDAEAVLLALGPRLEWDEHLQQNGVAFCSQVDEGFYWVLPVEDTGTFRSVFSGSTGDFRPPDRRKDVPTAQSACERHFATGKWE